MLFLASVASVVSLAWSLCSPAAALCWVLRGCPGESSGFGFAGFVLFPVHTFSLWLASVGHGCTLHLGSGFTCLLVLSAVLLGLWLLLLRPPVCWMLLFNACILLFRGLYRFLAHAPFGSYSRSVRFLLEVVASEVGGPCVLLASAVLPLACGVLFRLDSLFGGTFLLLPGPVSVTRVGPRVSPWSCCSGGHVLVAPGMRVCG